MARPAKSTTAPLSTEVTDVTQAETATKQPTQLPPHIDSLLKIYGNYEVLWIDAQGGVFSDEPKQTSTAIKYNNPYYKK